MLTSFDQPDWLKHIEMAVKYGYSILIKNVEKIIDPILDNLIGKNYRGENGAETVLLGDREIPVDKSFKLFFVTSNEQSNFLPDVFSKTCVIDYSVTLKVIPYFNILNKI